MKGSTVHQVWECNLQIHCICPHVEICTQIDCLCGRSSLAFLQLTCEIMDFKIFLHLSLFLINSNANQKCPVNCKCENIMSVCDILFCDDNLYVDTILLQVEGRMCLHHYDLLSQETHGQLLFRVGEV